MPAIPRVDCDLKLHQQLDWRYVDGRILHYLGTLAGKNTGRWCAPSLMTIAESIWISPYQVQRRLLYLEGIGRVIPAMRCIEDWPMPVLGWVMPRAIDWRATRTRPDR